MESAILHKKGANFMGIETVAADNSIKFDLGVIRGSGDLYLTRDELYFKQWLTNKEYFIALAHITKLELSSKHNGKKTWPGKVLKIYYREHGETQIFGIVLGGKLSLTKGWSDDSYIWKEKIESLK